MGTAGGQFLVHSPIRSFEIMPMKILIYCSALFACSVASGQHYSPSAEPLHTFSQLQEHFYNWKESADLQADKGWKPFARWMHFQETRLDPNGSLPSPTIFYNEAIRIADQKKNGNHRGAGWYPIGPDESVYNRLARFNCIAFHPTDTSTFWVGVAQGGVWKTVDDGQTWMPLTDDLPILRISDIAVDPNDPDIIYICVGDYAYLGVGLDLDGRDRNTHYGLGVYKTTDGGLTWNPTGLSFDQTQRDESLMRRVFIDPSNTNRLVAAGISGIWRSDDAGANWTHTLDTLLADLEKDPTNPYILYATSIYVSNLNRGSAGIIKSTDFGDSWTWLTTPIPPFNVQRVELTVAQSDPNYIYAVATNLSSGFHSFYRSTNAGANWTVQHELANGGLNLLGWSNGGGSSGQGWYDLCILTHPTNRDEVYVGGVNLWGSTDGGATWDGMSYWADNYQLTSCHADLHQLAYNPLDGQTYLCNDGGLVRTRQMVIGSWADRNNNQNYVWPTVWDDLSQNLQVTSFYRLGVHKADPSFYAAGSQDNSTFYLNNPTWENIIGGDGMECAINPIDPKWVIGSSQYGRIVGYHADGPNYAFPDLPNENGEWTTPFTFDSIWSTMYYGLENIWKTTDLDNGLPRQQLSNFSNNAVISHFDVAPSDNDVIYAAKRINFPSTPAEVWYTDDEGDNWTNVTSGLPDSLYPNYITIDNDNPDTAWIVFGGFIDGVKVFQTHDAGSNWQNVTKDLPNIPVNCIVHHRNSPGNRVYIGTDIGVYYSDDTSTTWTLYAEDLPNVIVTELEPHYATNTLYASTFGRGLWAVDMPDFDTTVIVAGADTPEHFGISVWPNPASGSFQVRLNLPPGEVRLSMVDVMGREVFAQKAANLRPYSITPHLPSGTYFVKVTSNGRTHSQRIILR